MTNSAGVPVEMPYVKANPAVIGGSNAKEPAIATANAATATATAPRGKAAVMRRVTVKPLPKSRAGSVTTETMYEVDARFSLELESVHTGTDEGRTLNFAVNYVGIVETTTELLDPESTLSYAWQVKRGSSSGRTPFVKTGEVMELILNQRSHHRDEYGNESESRPAASVTVSASLDTLWAADREALSRLVETTASSNANAESSAQRFSCGDQRIAIDWSYQTAESPLAYCSLHPVRLKGVTVDRLPDATVPGRQADVYSVTATFEQTLSTNGVTAGDREETVEYVVRYIGAVEVMLVKVEYRRDYAWIEAHDNIPLTSHLIVYRDRTYSNGETYTDTFRSGNTAIEGLAVSEYNGDGTLKGNEAFLGNGEKLIIKDYPPVYNDNGMHYYTVSGVPDLSLVKEFWTRGPECTTHEADGTHLEEYPLMGKGTLYNPENPTPGWYFDAIGHVFSKAYDYGDDGLRTYSNFVRFYDRFLCVDDTIIDFRDMNMVKNFDFRTIDLPSTSTRGPAKVHILDCKGHYLGRDFYYSITDTIYQLKN